MKVIEPPKMQKALYIGKDSSRKREYVDHLKWLGDEYSICFLNELCVDDQEAQELRAKDYFSLFDFEVVACSNNPFFINAAPLEAIHICTRVEDTLVIDNILSKSEKFAEWRALGLPNYDLLTSEFLYK
jgi:hypothetical protein